MRISDWRSDVCSSDLPQSHPDLRSGRTGGVRAWRIHASWHRRATGPGAVSVPACAKTMPYALCLPRSGDRKSVVKGKRVSVRVDLGGRRCIKIQIYHYINTRLELNRIYFLTSY